MPVMPFVRPTSLGYRTFEQRDLLIARGMIAALAGPMTLVFRASTSQS
jgi:hypothetical protein